MRLPGNKQALLLIFLLALGLRLWGIGDFETLIGDERMFVEGSKNYFSSGHATPDGWWHPPFHYFLFQANIWLMGNNPYGWRLASVLLGGFSVLILMLLCRELIADDRVANIAGLLLAVEPFHVAISRTAFREVPSTFFFLLAIYCIVLFCKRDRALLLPAGLFFGLSIAMKWYYVPSLAVLFAYAFHYGPRDVIRKGWLRTAHLFSALVVLPLGVYLLIHYPWFQRGYGLAEFFSMQHDAYRENQAIQVTQGVKAFLSSTDPSDWFIKPLISTILVRQEGVWGQFFVFMNNPPVWFLTFPALGYLIYRSWHAFDRHLALIAALFLSLYLPFALMHRDIFLYSALVVLPFAFLATAYFLVFFIERSGKADLSYTVLIALVLAWGLYLYPFVTSRFVPIGLYSPFISAAGSQ